MPRPSTPTLLLMVVRFFVPLRARAGSDSPACRTDESADHDGGSVKYVLDRLFGAGDDLVHGRKILSDGARIYHARGTESTSLEY